MKIRPVGAELFHANGQTDMTRLIVAFYSSARGHKVISVLHPVSYCGPNREHKKVLRNLIHPPVHMHATQTDVKLLQQNAFRIPLLAITRTVLSVTYVPNV
jgi:truncated hemoglobin YjbI